MKIRIRNYTFLEWKWMHIIFFTDWHLWVQLVLVLKCLQENSKVSPKNDFSCSTIASYIYINFRLELFKMHCTSSSFDLFTITLFMLLNLFLYDLVEKLSYLYLYWVLSWSSLNLISLNYCSQSARSSRCIFICLCLNTLLARGLGLEYFKT